MSETERLAQEQFDSMFGSKQAVSRHEAELEKAKEIIKRMLPLMPNGYNDMGNCDFIWEVKREAEQFLEETENG